jgi:predicted metal-dependent HD superfamily phosphohydrolase
LDADLSILGKDLDTYLAYTKMIRKEYSIYPDFLYKPGRKKGA